MQVNHHVVNKLNSNNESVQTLDTPTRPEQLKRPELDTSVKVYKKL